MVMLTCLVMYIWFLECRNLLKYLDAEMSVKAMVVDDLMSECVNNNIIADAFTKKRHHRNVSVILLVQNLFCQGRIMRTVHLNTEYVVLFGNARDKGQFNHFTRHIEPLNSKRLMEAYINATSKPLSHMLVDLKPLTPNPLRYIIILYQTMNRLYTLLAVVKFENIVILYCFMLHTFIQKQNI